MSQGRLKQKVIWKYNGDRPKVEPNTLVSADAMLVYTLFIMLTN